MKLFEQFFLKEWLTKIHFPSKSHKSHFHIAGWCVTPHHPAKSLRDIFFKEAMETWTAEWRNERMSDMWQLGSVDSVSSAVSICFFFHNVSFSDSPPFMWLPRLFCNNTMDILRYMELWGSYSEKVRVPCLFMPLCRWQSEHTVQRHLTRKIRLRCTLPWATGVQLSNPPPPPTPSPPLP